MRKIKPVVFLIAFAVSCGLNNTDDQNLKNEVIVNDYAKGFIIHYDNHHNKIIDVINPWEKASDITISYTLTKDTACKSENKICIPVQKVVCLSTSYCAIIDELGKTGSIAGISGSNYLYNPSILKKIENKEIMDIGYTGTLHYESILKLNPDVVFIYGLSADVIQSVNKLQELGIKTVITGEYLENHPLGRLEWIKFFAAFFDMENIADQKFDSIVNNYKSLKRIADSNAVKPLVISGSPWRGTWYIPGGKSDMAKLINDAGGDYVWKNLDTRENIPLSLENIFIHSLDADYWINTGYADKKSDLSETDERFKEFKAFKNGNVFNNNKLKNETGGIDFYESGIVHPDIILNDLIQIFHPQLFQDRELHYYKKLK